jgi:hypothetical protein
MCIRDRILVPAAPSGFARLLTTLTAINSQAGAVFIDIQDNFGYGIIKDLPGASNVPVELTSNILPMFCQHGNLSCNVGGAGLSVFLYGEYVTFSLDGHEIVEGILDPTTTFATVPNIVPTDASKTAIPFAQTWLPGYAPQLDFIMGVDSIANTVQFRITRGATVLTFNKAIAAGVNKTQLPVGFPGLIAGDVVEARLLTAPVTPGQIHLRMIREFVANSL